MSPKKIISWIRDYDKPLHQRTFILMTISAFITLGIIFIWDIFIGESALKLFVLGTAVVSLLLIVYITMRFDCTQAGAVIVSIAIIIYVLPMEFFTGGGVYGCTPIWYAFAFMYVGVNVQGRIKYPLLGGVLLSAIVCYILAFFNPWLLTEHDMKTAYLDSIASLIGVGSLLFFSVTFMIRLYSRENELTERQKREIEELSRSQNRFFSSMSHEIRTPINTIIGLNEMTLREESISDEVADNSRNIRSASNMLLTTINDLLDISKIESGKMNIVPVEYNLGDMLSDVVGMTWLRAKEKGLEFHVEVDKSCPAKLYGDEVRIKQILINIVTNAIKYTQKGSVTLSIRCRHIEGNTAVMVYSVSDTGIGIKRESLPYLFNAFSRVDEDRNRYIEGTGLGLSIVKQFVEMMGGTISVNSVYTKGSTFVVELPQEILDHAAVGELNLEAKHSLGRREHYRQSFEAPNANVLVVDDNETNILVVTKLLRDTKMHIDTAGSGLEALSLCLQRHYDVILMDHLMPEMDGVECLHEIRNQVGGLNLSTPVVILTANAGSENQAMYKREGFDGYLLKPVSGAMLEAELLNQLPKDLVIVSGEKGLSGDSGLVVERRQHKVSVLITTESLCDLPESVIREYGIMVLPHNIMTDRGWFLDGEEIESEGLLAYMEEGGNVRTKTQNVEDIEEFFAEALTKAQQIIHISLARNVSDAYDNALEAAKSFDNVTVVDSGHLSSGLGMLVSYAASCAAGDMSAQDILSALPEVSARIRTSFMVSTTEYLYRSGRISRKLHETCTSLMVHPVLGLKHSNMSLIGVRLGTREYAWKRYIKKELSGSKDIDTSTLYITYAGLNREELAMVAEEVGQYASFEKVVFQKASPTISANCGPGTFGLIFMVK